MSEAHEDAPVDAPAAVNRITIGLINDASVAMERLQRRTGMSKTDIVNRGVQLYDMLDAELRLGSRLYLRADGSTELQQVRFL